MQVCKLLCQLPPRILLISDLPPAFGIAQTGEVVGISQTAHGTDEAFLWTRGGGMRSLGTLGGPVSVAFGVNTHRRVVGASLTATNLVRPFLWTAGAGIRSLPTLGGDFGEASYLNEFGNIVGRSFRSDGALRATLWTPIPGPLAVAPIIEDVETGAGGAAALGKASVVSCAATQRRGDWSRLGVVSRKACLAQ